MSNIFSLENKAFSSLVVYGSLALVKTAALSFLTVRGRFKHKAVPSMEDARVMAPNNPEKQKQALVPNEIVERVRRAHLNDLENVVPFVIMGLLYVSTNPDPVTALWHFRIFLASRIFHSIAYVNAIRQPARALGFFGGMIVFMSMAFQTIKATYQYL